MDELRELLSSIRARLAGQTARVRGIVGHAGSLAAESGRFMGLITERGARNGPYVSAHTEARNALCHAVDLGHESEVAISVGFLLDRIGLDLRSLVDKTDVGGGAMGQVWVEQRGAATLFSAGSEPSQAAVSHGEVGINVPLRLVFFGQVREIDLHLNLVIVRNARTGGLETCVSRGPHIQPSLDTPSMTLRVIQAFNDQAASRLRKALPVPPSADFGFGDPQYYSADFDSKAGLFRLFGTFGHKRRSVCDRVASIPEWANLTMKVRSAVFLELVAREVRRAGASMSPVTYPAEDRFRFAAAGSGSKGKRILGVKFSVDVTVTFFLEGVLTVGGATVHLRVGEYRQKAERIRYHPRVIDFLYGWTKRWIRDFVAGMIPAVRFNETYWVPEARRLAVALSQDSFKIHMTF